MSKTFNKLNYKGLPKKVNKQGALDLLKALQKEIHSSTEKRNRAIVWGRDLQGLTYEEMAEAMDYNSHVTIYNIYQATKGGNRS